MSNRLEGGRTWLAILTVLALVMTLFAAFSGGTARADHEPPDDIVAQQSGSNEAPFWEDYLSDVRGIDDATCSKIDDADDDAYVLGDPPAGKIWVLLVVKQATDNFVYYDPVSGHSYPSTGQQGPGYSHLITCWTDPPATTTTTTQPTTTTTQATTTTTQATTTTTQATTTTTQATTTTTQATTTTTQPEPTTTTTEETTTTTILGTTITSPTSTLPFTGIDSDQMVGIAIMLLGSGLLLTIAGMGRREEA